MTLEASTKHHTFHRTRQPSQFHILYFEEWLEGVRRSVGDYETPYFYFDPSDAASLATLNGYMERSERDIATRKPTVREAHHAGGAHPPQHAQHRARRFNLQFTGNLPPPAVDSLVERLGSYFPYTVPYSRALFNTSTPEQAVSMSRMADSALPGTFSCVPACPPAIRAPSYRTPFTTDGVLSHPHMCRRTYVLLRAASRAAAASVRVLCIYPAAALPLTCYSPATVPRLSLPALSAPSPPSSPPSSPLL